MCYVKQPHTPWAETLPQGHLNEKKNDNLLPFPLHMFHLFSINPSIQRPHQGIYPNIIVHVPHIVLLASQILLNFYRSICLFKIFLKNCFSCIVLYYKTPVQFFKDSTS